MNNYLDRDLVFELDEKLQISKAHATNLDGNYLPEEIIDVPFALYDENLREKYAIQSMTYDKKISTDKKPVLNELLPNSGHFCMENGETCPISNHFLTDDIKVLINMPSDHENASELSTQSNLSGCIGKEYYQIKQSSQESLVKNSSQAELKPLSKWKSSFKPVPSPQCMVIKNVSTYSCKINNCGRDFFCNEELVTHIKEEHCDAEHRTTHLTNMLKSDSYSNIFECEEENFKKNFKKEATSFQKSDEVIKDTIPFEQLIKKRRQSKPILDNCKERILRCGRFNCSLKFSSMDNLQHHIKCHDFSNYSTRNFACNFCNKHFFKWTDCSLHLWKVHKQDVDLFSCGICKTYKSDTLGKMVLHQETHMQDSPYVCEFCSKIFKQIAQLRAHICKKKPIEDQPLWAQKSLCNECNKWFSTYRTYVQHYNTIHLKLKRFSCSQCSYSSYTKNHFTTHERTHSKIKPYTCEICGLSVTDHNSIRRHRLTHIPKRNISCPVRLCSFSTVNSTAFKMHLLKLHPKEIPTLTCQFCTFSTLDIEEYLNHKSFHEKELLKILFEKVKLDKGNSLSDKELEDKGVLDRDTFKNNCEILDDCTKIKCNKMRTPKFNQINEVFENININSRIHSINHVRPDGAPKVFNDLAYIKISTVSTFSDSAKRIIKRRKVEENFGFESVLLIE